MRRRTRQDGELANKSTSRHKYRVVAAVRPFDGIFTIVGKPARVVSICYIHVKSAERACGAVGSALPWHGRGREFESHQVHQLSLEQDRIAADPGNPGGRPVIRG